MDRFPYHAEAHQDQLCQLISAHIDAIENDVRIGRVSTTERLLDRLDEVGESRADALAILRAAVVGRSQAVGVDNAAAVQAAIYFEAEALAEGDLAEMERGWAESQDDDRIERAAWHREFA